MSIFEEKTCEEKTFEEKVQEITPDVYLSLKRAVELGKWPNGDRLTDKQREICMQAVLHYNHAQLPEDQRIGYIEKRGCKSGGQKSDLQNQVLKHTKEQENQQEQEAQPIKFS